MGLIGTILRPGRDGISSARCKLRGKHPIILAVQANGIPSVFGIAKCAKTPPELRRISLYRRIGPRIVEYINAIDTVYNLDQPAFLPGGDRRTTKE
jgi:hypothetical protein